MEKSGPCWETWTVWGTVWVALNYRPPFIQINPLLPRRANKMYLLQLSWKTLSFILCRKDQFTFAVSFFFAIHLLYAPFTRQQTIFSLIPTRVIVDLTTICVPMALLGIIRERFNESAKAVTVLPREYKTIAHELHHALLDVMSLVTYHTYAY